MRNLATTLVRPLIVVGLIAILRNLASAQELLGTQITQIGDAQVQTLVQTGFFPDRQPVIFWHDPDWKVDLLLPANKEGGLLLRIRPRVGKELVVALPTRAVQIKAILRAPIDKVIVDTDSDSEREGFVIIDLETGIIVDDLVATDTSISPNRRFVLFDDWISNWDDSDPHEFRLYDVLRTPRENTCGYSTADPKHEKLDDFLRGIQVLPLLPGPCSDNDRNLGWDYGFDFTWTPDSSKVVFADVRKGRMTLVVVTMPAGKRDLPKAWLYLMKGAQDVCAGDQYCDYHVIQSLRWDGNSVKADFQHQFGTPLNLNVTIPVSAFVPIGK